MVNEILHHLVARELLAVGFAGDGSLTHDVQRSLREPDPAHRVMDAPPAESLLGEHEAIAGLPDQILVRHAAILEADLGVVAELAEDWIGAVHRRNVTDDDHSGRPLLDDEHRGVLIRPTLRIRLGHHDDEIREGPVRAKPFMPVDDPVFALLARLGAESRRVGARFEGLRQSERASNLPL